MHAVKVRQNAYLKYTRNLEQHESYRLEEIGKSPCFYQKLTILNRNFEYYAIFHNGGQLYNFLQK